LPVSKHNIVNGISNNKRYDKNKNKKKKKNTKAYKKYNNTK
jgi:hypothetical protein